MLLSTTLDALIEMEKVVTVYLVNGVKLTGAITAYDPEDQVLALVRQGSRQLVSLSAIATIMTESDANAY